MWGALLKPFRPLSPEFDLEPIGLTSRGAFDTVKDHKNIFFVGLIADSSSLQFSPESDYMNSIFASDSLRQMIFSGFPALVARSNHWRRNQLVYYLAAADSRGSHCFYRATFRAIEVPLQRNL